MNFEALGRYTEATERAARLAKQRDNQMAELARQLTIITGSKSGSCVAVFADFEALTVQLAEADKTDAELCQAIAEAKLIADGVDIEGAEVWYAAWKYQAANAFDTLQHISESIADVMRRGPNVLFRYDPDKLTVMDAQAYSNPSIRRMGITRRAVLR